MAATQFNDAISYEIFDDGYDIYLNGENWISQREPYNRIYKPDGTDEENCLLQIGTLIATDEEPVEEEKTE